jgi:C-terminal peptidase (prc)
MNDNRPGKFKVWAPLICALVLVLGMVLGFNLRDTLRSKRDIINISTRNDRLEQIIDLVAEKYVDTVDANKLYEDAIKGILSHLDPHTSYLSADQFETSNEELDGGFFGIGVEFEIINDTIQVLGVNENGPAAVAGMAIGDKLIQVGDSIVAGKSITSKRIMKMLKGKQYSRVYITLLRADDASKKVVSVKRDIVPVYSVEASVMLNANTGYIKINKFGATTHSEFKTALKGLQAAGMDDLIIDVRQNPGGYLGAAVNIIDELLDDDKVVVYTEGKSSPRYEYRTDKKGIFEKGRLIILVDETSASASEILAGAIQDWDRGLIIGRRTYGKGLVQEQYDMDDGAGLRLTVAKYYTPSGRSIQRTYAKGREAYESDFIQRYHTGELTGYDTLSTGDTVKHYTSKRRVVYGGGGIKPDVYVGYDTSKLTNAMLNLVYSDEVKNYVWAYFLANRKALMQYKDMYDFSANYDAMPLMNGYLQTLPAGFRKAATKLLSSGDNKEFMRLQMKAQLARMLYRDNGYYLVSAKEDEMIRRALKELQSSDYLKLIGR